MPTTGYGNPGVTVRETLNPALAPLISNPSEIALVGAAAGSQSATERVFLAGTTPVTLRYTGISTGSVVVSNNATGEVINPGNYTITQGTDPNTGITGDEPYTITRISSPTGATQVPVAATGTGTLTGSFVYAYSYVNAAGESGLSSPSNTVVLTAQGANLSNITVGPTGTTARNIYRAPVVAGVTGQFTLVGTLANNSATTLTGETAAASTTLPKIGIADGETVTVSYTYTDQYYYQPTLFNNYNDIVDKYGAPFDASGNISSPLSFAASLAFQNGASEIVLLASASGSDTDISNALSNLATDDIQMVGVVSGSASVHSALSAHITSMVTQGLFRMGVVGRDGTSSPISAQLLRTGQLYNNQGLIMVSPTTFKLTNPITGRDLIVGGQYAAAAVMGMFAARDVQIPLTRKTVAGFTGILDNRNPTDAALDSQAGLMVLEVKNGVIRVRHGVTTATGNVNTAEASVVRAKYDMAMRLKLSLDGIIGQVAPVQDVPGIVSSLVAGVLEQIVTEGGISSYSNVQARLLASDLTTVEVAFQYLPAYPINNIVISFTINTQSGAFNASGITSQSNSNPSGVQ